MRIKELFTVPEGEKITEKLFGRVLLSSVCSIFLCLACLFGTTWAWFTVSIENTDNVIQTAAAPSYVLQVDGTDPVSGHTLQAGSHTVTVTHTSNADALQKKSTLYVTLSFGGNPYGYAILGGEHPGSLTLPVTIEEDLPFSWEVSWFAPGNPAVGPIDGGIQVMSDEPEAETAAATEASTAATDPTITEATDPTITEATDPTTATEATDPTAATGATDPTTATGATDPPAEETTTPTEGSTEPSGAPTDAPAATQSTAETTAETQDAEAPTPAE